MTDFDTTSEDTPTEPIPAPERWRPSTGGIVAMAVAGALMLSTIAFGAGWGAHGVATRVDARRGFAMAQDRGGYGQQQNGQQQFDGRGDCPMGGQSSADGQYGRGGRGGMAPQDNGYGQQDGWDGQSDPHQGVPGFGQ